MTRLLEQAIAKARKLPEDKQDAAVEALFAHLAGDDGSYRLTPEQVADVDCIRQDLRAGRTRLASDDEVAVLWKKCGF